MVATVFRELLTGTLYSRFLLAWSLANTSTAFFVSDPSHFGGRFRTVVFAIPPSRKNNYQAFASYFQKNG